MKNQKYVFTLLISAALSFSCSSSKKTVSPSNLPTSISKTTASKNLEITIPKGWMEIKDNHEQLFDIWLINDAKTASICFIPIKVSENFSGIVNQPNIELVKDIVINNKKKSNIDFEIIEENKLNSEYDMIGSKIKINDNLQNSVILEKDMHFFECLAYFKNVYSPTADEIDSLFETQLEILKNLKIN